MRTLFSTVLLAACLGFGCGNHPTGVDDEPDAGGAVPTDTGGTGSDAGTSTDGGFSSSDGGPLADGGSSTPDGGSQTDGGPSSSDGGVPSPDGGAPSTDGGTSSPDGGSTSPDGGTGTDGGSSGGCSTNADCPSGKVCDQGVCVCDGGDACAPDKTLLCHVPPGQPDDRHTICVGASAVSSHQAHGDALGSCP